MEKFEIIKEDLKNILSEKRYNHSVGAAKAAAQLAKIYGEDEEVCALTALAHDIAKEIPNDQKLMYVKENNIEIDEIEKCNVRSITCQNRSRYSKEKI